VGLLSVFSPLAPIRGLISFAEMLRERAERELRDPATARRQLEEVQEARAAGRISAEEEATLQEEILNRMMR
jgi:hypothetical protein